MLAATIIVAVTGTHRCGHLREAWHYDKADALSLIATALGVMALRGRQAFWLGVALSLGTWCGAAAIRTHVGAGCRAPSISAT